MGANRKNATRHCCFVSGIFVKETQRYQLSVHPKVVIQPSHRDTKSFRERCSRVEYEVDILTLEGDEKLIPEMFTKDWNIAAEMRR